MITHNLGITAADVARYAKAEGLRERTKALLEELGEFVADERRGYRSHLASDAGDVVDFLNECRPNYWIYTFTENSETESAKEGVSFLIKRFREIKAILQDGDFSAADDVERINKMVSQLDRISDTADWTFDKAREEGWE